MEGGKKERVGWSGLGGSSPFHPFTPFPFTIEIITVTISKFNTKENSSAEMGWKIKDNLETS